MPSFVKRHANAEAAAEIRRRSSVLVANGVPTPLAEAGRCARDVAFEPLAGETGHVLASGGLSDLLAVLGRLHDTEIPGLSLFDPFLRIRPRLSLTHREPIRHILRETVPSGSATLHGDLHVGQFIRDRAGKVWIVDLDDLAIGPPEADLANFTAHLVTSFPHDGSVPWSRRVRDAWGKLGRSCDDAVFSRFLRFALVRRHLKLREAGRYDFEVEVLDYLRDSSNFSIR